MQEREGNFIGLLLLNAGIITSEDLEKALTEHKRTGEFLAATIVKLKFALEEDVFSILGEQLGISFINLRTASIDPEALEKVSARFALHYKIMPVSFKNNLLGIVVSDPLNVQVLDDIRMLLNVDVKAYIAYEKSIIDAISKNYGLGAGTVEGLEDKEEVKEEKKEDQGVEESSIINFVNQVLTQAVKDRATDIHIEPFEDELTIRYRIDGILHKTPLPQGAKQFQNSITSRIKIMANLNIAERRLPQDGKILFKLGEEEYDLRVSTLPTPEGESIDLRILSKTMLFNFKDLGLLEENSLLLEQVLKKPNGVIFVTGPTGSGKTTTLYSCLQNLNTQDRKIITVEDPIEYRIKGITQIQVYPKIGLSFAYGLRSILRHDPDIILIGEVRDVETAEIAIRASLTGHLVFSTIHTNDAASGVTRLLDMGIEPYLIASTVECFIAQRLVRVLCPKCKFKVKAADKILKAFGEKEDIDIYDAKGCEECKYTKYRGRTAIYEFLLVSPEIKDLIAKKSSASKIKEQAVKSGMRTLKMEGWQKIKQGMTTVDEILRVVSREEMY
ncbi:MAG: ATPase, T2SS/T4P/T4SS family [Candidatus Kaelpia aquatica]|nr:ATPase, T2SS/T4P/T4SS family [Candidatus Kaelpia aquatica]